MSNTKTFEFKNDFHNSSVELRLKRIEGDRWYISAGQARKARNALCGNSSCTCGGSIGERPGREIVPVADGFVFYNN